MTTIFGEMEMKGVPPSDMKACFGGSAWEYVPEIGQYYFHQFLPEQPDFKLGESKGQKSNLRYDSLVDGQGESAASDLM